MRHSKYTSIDWKKQVRFLRNIKYTSDTQTTRILKSRKKKDKADMLPYNWICSYKHKHKYTFFLQNACCQYDFRNRLRCNTVIYINPSGRELWNLGSPWLQKDFTCERKHNCMCSAKRLGNYHEYLDFSEWNLYCFLLQNWQTGKKPLIKEHAGKLTGQFRSEPDLQKFRGPASL